MVGTSAAVDGDCSSPQRRVLWRKPIHCQVKAHGGRSLELLVWPEGGLDNFVERVDSGGDVGRAESEFRRLVSLYAEGQRPPFSG
jgi:hypothetical protein